MTVIKNGTTELSVISLVQVYGRPRLTIYVDGKDKSIAQIASDFDGAETLEYDDIYGKHKVFNGYTETMDIMRMEDDTVRLVIDQGRQE